MALYLRPAMSLVMLSLLFAFSTVAISKTTQLGGEKQFKAAQQMKIHNGYMLAPGQADSRVFMDIENSGPQSQQIIGATTPIATQVKIMSDLRAYTNNNEGPMPLQYVSIPRGGYSYFRPGGNYFLLLGVDNNNLQDGQRVPFTLLYSDGSSSQVEVPIYVSNSMLITSQPGYYYGPGPGPNVGYGYGPRSFYAPSLYFFPFIQQQRRR